MIDGATLRIDASFGDLERLRRETLRRLSRDFTGTERLNRVFVEVLLARLIDDLAAGKGASLRRWFLELTSSNDVYEPIVKQVFETLEDASREMFGPRAAEAVHQRRILLTEKTEKSAAQTAKPEGMDALATATAMVESIDDSYRSVSLHMRKVSAVVTHLAKRLNISPEDTQRLHIAAMVFDMGKCDVPDDVLHNHSPLTNDQWLLVREHSVAGAERVRAYPQLVDLGIDAIIRSHHERYDGHGYPDGLAGEAIPYLSRVLAVADSFCSMIGARPYREPLTVADALDQLTKGAGAQWDPRIVRELVSFICNPIIKSSDETAKPRLRSFA
jgi:HD-GYP domain-containing protein (c-di-GMP phosphodiesterase class II)